LTNYGYKAHLGFIWLQIYTVLSETQEQRALVDISFE
jgi:hypothetical protein